MAIDKLINIVDEVIDRSPPTRKKMIVYRGDRDDTYFNRNTGDIFFKNKGIISTTLSYNEAIRFTSEKVSYINSERCCMNEITVLPGSRILFIGGVSTLPQEIEFILGMNTTYLMRKYRERKYVKDYKICSDKIGNRKEILVTSLVALGKK
jgi:hypothetical protein